MGQQQGQGAEEHYDGEESMSKHTPGPWEWYGPNLLCGGKRQSEDILNSADDRKPYGMHSALIEHHWDGDVAKANARLIAAAPEMYDALKALVESPNTFSSHDKARAEELLARINGDKK